MTNLGHCTACRTRKATIELRKDSLGNVRNVCRKCYELIYS